jgi:hypothetical protein
MIRTALAIALVLGLVGCKLRPSPSASSATATTSTPTITSATLPVATTAQPAAAPAPAPVASHDGTRLLLDAQRRLVKGKVAATTPLERKIGREISDLMGGDEEDDWSALVIVKEGKPRHVVVILQFDDLRDAKNGERKDFLAGLGMVVDEIVGSKADVTIGLKGKLVFGAVAVKKGSGGYKKTTGVAVDSKPLEDALAAM